MLKFILNLARRFIRWMEEPRTSGGPSVFGTINFFGGPPNPRLYPQYYLGKKYERKEDGWLL